MRGAAPGKLNVETVPTLAHILIFRILLVFSRLLFFSFARVFSVCFSKYRYLQHANSLSFYNFVSECWLVGPLQLSFAPPPSINLQLRHCLQPSQRSHTPVCMLATSTANTSTGATAKYLLTVEPGLLGNSQQHWAAAWPIGSSQFLLSPMERQHQPGFGLRECRPGQPIAEQTCSRNVPAVTTTALCHNAIETQRSCPQRSGEALESPPG